jgi:hypothetical protein
MNLIVIPETEISETMENFDIVWADNRSFLAIGEEITFFSKYF